MPGNIRVAPELSALTIMHFGAAILIFHIGLLGLGRLPNLQPFWLLMCLSFLFIFWIGIDQHNGGLEATRFSQIRQTAGF